VYHYFHSHNNKRHKLIKHHAFLGITAITCALIGFGLVFKFKEKIRASHFESDHARFGIGILGLILFQASVGIRKAWLKLRHAQSTFRWHARLGLFIFTGMVMNACLGVRAMWRLLDPDFGKVGLASTCFVLLGLLALLVVFFDFWLGEEGGSPNFYGRTVYVDEKEPLVNNDDRLQD